VDPTYGFDLYQEPRVHALKYSGLVDVLVYHKPLVENHAELEASWMLERILEMIQKEIEAGFQYKDIAILTRKNKQSKFLAIQLKERNIRVISSDSLLVHYAKVVGFLISFMRLKTLPNDEFKFKELLFQYADLCQEVIDVQAISSRYQKHSNFYEISIKYFEELGFHFQEDESHVVAWIYGLVSTFNLTRFSTEIEYLFKLLDIINDFVLTKSDDFSAFLAFYDANKASFSIASPEGNNAITISSIHRSKGLEYPVVISPFVSWTHQPKSEQLWFDLKSFDFDELRLNDDVSLNYYYGKVVPKELSNYDSLSQQQSAEFDAVFLDALNMLYVAFTRPKQHLHILLAEPNEAAHAQTKGAFQKSLGQIVLDYCLSNPAFEAIIPPYFLENESTSYYLIQAPAEFIQYQAEAEINTSKVFALATQVQDVVDFRIQSNKDDLFTSAHAKRERGDLVHEFLSKISDVDYYRANKDSLTKQMDIETISLIDLVFSNEAICSFFKPNELLFCERDILCPDGDIIRPDRVIQQHEFTYIIDFKTGKENDEHQKQLEKYKLKLSQIGYVQLKGVLIYIESLHVEEV